MFLLSAAAEAFSNSDNLFIGSNGVDTTLNIKESRTFPAFGNLSKEDVDMSADSYEYIGSNLVAHGHVVIKIKEMLVTADSAVINLVSKDMEASGKVRISCRIVKHVSLTQSQYETYQQDPEIKVVVKGIETSPLGEQKIKAELTMVSSYIQAERISGNLLNGTMQFRKFKMAAGPSYFSGKLAERYSNGTFKFFDSRLSTCEYELDDNAHYSLSAKEMYVTPRDNNRNLSAYNPDMGEHSILALNNFLRVWDVPVLWIPALYKPRDLNLFGFRFEFGSRTEWGTYIRTTKEFDIPSPDQMKIKAGVIVDYYARRDMGFGMTADILSANSKTEFFGYYMYDRNPNAYWSTDRDSPRGGMSQKEWSKYYGRYNLPKNRYEFRLSNITHLTPRLDFRGQMDIISDFNFLEDFFETRYDQDVQPPTNAALEYQGDRFSASLYIAYKINDFDTAVNRLPELRFDFQRQELFKNIYYQGETSAGYYQMRWRKTDYERNENPNINFYSILQKQNRMDLAPAVAAFGNNTRGAANYLVSQDSKAFSGYFEDPKDYSAFRFDTLHGFYYPMKFFDALNLIPRAMVRFTAYSESTDQSIRVNDLYGLFSANQLDTWPDSTLKLKNYDNNGNAQFRFAFELGLEGNMKFYRAWNDVRSPFFQLDGLRHVAVPYFNLVYMPRPTVNYDQLYYFDEVDQLEKEAFIRFGIQNRLQTRRNDKMYQWISMENYWDFHFEDTDDFNHIGDLGTTVTISPTENLSIFSELLLDIGKNNDHDAKVYQGSEQVGRPGISSDLINRLTAGVSYKIGKDWKFSASYNYSDEYAQRSTMSMGSTLTQIMALNGFKAYYKREQTISGSISFPTIIDKRLTGRFTASYNIESNIVDHIGLYFIRNFHCWYLSFGASISSERNEKSDLEWPWEVSLTFGLSAMPAAQYTSSQKGGN